MFRLPGRFEPKPGLDLVIARRFGVPALHRAVDMLHDAAQSNAPDTRTWVTMRDERVRPSHFEADGQTIPANLRFILDKPDGVGTELARAPRDPALSAANAANCRCDATTLPHPLRESIHKTDVRQEGTRVTGGVETKFPRAAESEFGTGQDQAAHFMTNAVREVAARLRAGHAR